MGCFRLIAICCILAILQGVVVVNASTMDEIISNAAEKAEEFAFFQGSEEAPFIKVELDMIFTPEQWVEIQMASGTYGDEHGRQRRKAIRSGVYRWPNGIVPYEFAPGVFTSRQKGEIDRALNEWQQYTCLKFRSAGRADRDKIRFDNGGGCFSNVGKVGGSQVVGLAAGCRYKGVVVHEVGHAVGFQHEQTRPDRDDYVQIIRRNIPPHLYYNFQKYTVRSVNNYNIPYDYKSIMHYGPKAFSVNGGYTIKTLDPKYQTVIGNRQGMSFKDIKLANVMYNCNARCSNKDVKCPGEGFLDKNCRCMCPGNPVRECSDTSTRGTTSRVRTTTESGNGSNKCMDRHRLCSAWATNGECDRSKFYMSTYCKESCKICRVKENKCQDIGEHCIYWKKEGYCRFKYVEYMRSNCAKSCNTCGSVDSEVERTTAAVNDKEDGRRTGEGEENGGMTSLPGVTSLILTTVLGVLLR